MLDSAWPKGYVDRVILRRIIIALCLLALLPTTVDPSCVGYFVYSSPATVADAGDLGRDECGGAVTETARPAEGLAAARIPSQSRLLEAALVVIVARFVATADVVLEGRVERSPDFLAPALHDTYLRQSSLLI